MRIRKKKWAQPELDQCPYYIPAPQEYRGRWKAFFRNDNPICLEIGCGKCTFVAEMALRYPERNFIAVDIKNDMLGVGRRNIERLFAQKGRTVGNIALVPLNVDLIENILSEEDHIEALYINFCNPWPRKKHQKRRLTYPKKLNAYKSFLSEQATVYFKTDDDELFEDSLAYFRESGYTIQRITYDLHQSDIPGNIITEHEKMFSDEGVRIKYLEATPV